MSNNPTGPIGSPEIVMILTRPEGTGDAFVGQISEGIRARLRLVQSPLIGIEPLGGPVDLTGVSAVVLTSANAVRHAPKGQGIRAYCVGEITTQAARDNGWDAVFAGEEATALIDYLSAQPSREDLLHLSGLHHRVDIAGALRSAGISARHRAIYDQKLLPLSPAAQDALRANSAPVIAPLFSPRTAAQFVTEASSLRNVHIVALSEAVADRVRGSGAIDVTVARAPTRSEMVQSVENLVRRISLG